MHERTKPHHAKINQQLNNYYVAAQLYESRFQCDLPSQMFSNKFPVLTFLTIEKIAPHASCGQPLLAVTLAHVSFGGETLAHRQVGIIVIVDTLALKHVQSRNSTIVPTSRV